MTPLLVLLALFAAAFGAACALAGAGWMKVRSAASHRRLAREREQLAELSDAWLWQTDAELRITLWRPPAQDAAAWRAPAPLGASLVALASAAEAADAPALAQRLQARAPVPAQRVLLRMADAEGPWLLRALPCLDERGRFAGYAGSARPLQGQDGGFARAALGRLMACAGATILVFERPGGQAPWRLVDSTADAQALLRRAEPGSPAGVALDWAEACARLPAELGHALSLAPAGEPRTAGEWTVAWDHVPSADDPQAGRLMLLRRNPPAPAVPADGSETESFIYSVSHDLRAPIRVVEGFARILKEDYGRFLDRIGNDHVDRILAASARMNSMIDALLALSRLQSQPLKRQPVDLSQLARYILDDLRSQAPERQVEAEIQPGLIVQGDPTLMRIAVENLVGNAWKYSGLVAVAHITLRREQVAGQSAYVVADNGAGFDMRFADRLFGVFQRLHSAKDFQGTGIGLASVRRIIRRHGGDIWAESEVGKGARFYFTLPE